MNNINSKSLAFLFFYVITIVLALILFKSVTTYGETQLKVPEKISGNYRILSQDLPNCLKSDNLKLNIEQSGIYLLGILSLSSSNTPESKITLDGKLNDKQLSISAEVNQLANCQTSPRPNMSHSLKIEGTQQGQKLSGKIIGTAIPREANFTAVKLEDSSSDEQINH